MTRLRVGPYVVVASLAASLASPPSTASANEPDIREIRPIVMLAIDTSGSMEYRTTAASSPTCKKGNYERNRWAQAIEALTGTFTNFTCALESRTSSYYVGDYDYGYSIKHARLPLGSPQETDGILDVYRDRVRFALSTFDTQYTLTSHSDYTSWNSFNASSFLNASRGSAGDFSYGTVRAWRRPSSARDNTTYATNVGMRNEDAVAGALISVGNDWSDDLGSINDSIQASLLAVRPFNGTPIAPMLEDIGEYFTSHPDVRPIPYAGASGDPYYTCRGRYVILVTDGEPNFDMRESPYNCDGSGGVCPYKKPVDAAAALCSYDSVKKQCTGIVDGVYSLGFAASSSTLRGFLNDVAAVGGTRSALFADDRLSLQARLSEALDTIAAGTTTRTSPAFASAGGASGGTTHGQYEFNTGFKVGTQDAPWSGVLERRAYMCEGTEIQAQSVSDDNNDRFHLVLNRRTAARKLYTVLPSNVANADGWLVGETSTPVIGSGGGGSNGNGGAHGIQKALSQPGHGGMRSSCVARTVLNQHLANQSSLPTPTQTGLKLTPFATSNSTLKRQYFGVNNDTERNRLIDWVHATSSSTRAQARLGDIYHSSPVVVAPPRNDIPDEAYYRFRQRAEVANRPTVVYVGSNDGVMHAFAAEGTTIAAGKYKNRVITTGEELWGFVPSTLLSKINLAATSHQWMVDGTPVVHDVVFQRLPGDPGGTSEYKTVMVFGLRNGGAAYIALDITDPLDPKFLWQFTHAQMGAAFGTAGIGQVLVNVGGSPEMRAVALLPGGVGEDVTGSSASCGAGGSGCASTGKGRPPTTSDATPRTNQRCWATVGRGLFIVDIATGRLLKHLDDTIFNAPLTGGIGMFSGEEGTTATRAFTTDADGVVWRIDLSSPDPADWDADPFFDLFYDASATSGQPSYYPPVVSVDDDGRAVVLVGTGDIDALDGSAINRVASLTEKITYSSNGSSYTVKPILNWIIRLEAGAQVTGSVDLYDGRAYFGTFHANQNAAVNACDYGRSYLWGVDYRLAKGSSKDPKPGLESNPGSGVYDLTRQGPYLNHTVTGVGVIQRPNCYVGQDEFDPYVGGSRFRITASGGGSFELVASVGGDVPRTDGGSIGRITHTLPSPVSYTQMSDALFGTD